ncbi:hypothetical protein Aco03nite_083140 [Actinoplanes couchii]|uniref:Uncharacterized protein n=1 Tax=Actinoplanes couchii TaxID=403638 RepID=A0ABQ3XND6_9ACTN|nr:hypothetical protein Aco03nite_083140 [Actinoplanes couchii]
MFNLAALLASDCGIPDLARTWCHRLAASALDHDSEPKHALEPIVNLARLHIRAGDGLSAWKLLEDLFRAVDSRTDITIDGITIPIARLTETPTAYTETRQWLWTVLLGTGAHALAAAGRWDEASERLRQYRGIGVRMLDGRQVAVIAHVLAGRSHKARAMLAATQPGEPWENAVTACLALHVPAAGPVNVTATALNTFQKLGYAEAGLTVLHTRLGLSIIDALDRRDAARNRIVVRLIHRAARDGYAARELLAHPHCLDDAPAGQIRQLSDLMSACGLARGSISTTHMTSLDKALAIAERVIAAHGRRLPPVPV